MSHPPAKGTAPHRAGSAVRWWRGRSLRARLTAASTAVIIVGIALAAVLLLWRVHSTLASGLDNLLMQRAGDVAAEVTHGQLGAVRTTGADSTTLVQVIGAGGQVLSSSANIDGEPALFTFPATGTQIILRQIGAVPGADAGPYRVAAAAVGLPQATVTVYAARSMSEITGSTGQLGGALLLGAPLVMLLLGAVAWFLIGRALRPVEAIRAQVASISGTDLHRRLPVGDAQDELQRLTCTFNQMLDRIQNSSAAQRRFLADAAHELRTPVASIHTRLQVHTRHQQLPLTLVEQQLLAADAARLAALIGSLLSLARLDSHTALRREPVDLDDLIFDHTQRLHAAHPRLRVDTTQVSGAQVLGDRDTLDQVVANLLDNAAQHATTTITVDLHSTDTAATLTVADDGAGIPAADRDRVFERFTRLDHARSRNTGGTGLGLSIVADVVHAHHGTVHISDNQPGARLTITLPTTQQNTPPTSSNTGK